MSSKLQELFAKKQQKKTFKTANLNAAEEVAAQKAASAAAQKPAQRSPGMKPQDDEWVDPEQLAQTDLNLASKVGSLRFEQAAAETSLAAGADSDDKNKPAWGSVQKEAAKQDVHNMSAKELMERRKFPELAKQDASQDQKITVVSGRGGASITTSKNAFAALNNGQEDDEEEAKAKKAPAVKDKAKGEIDASVAPKAKKEEKKREESKEESKEVKVEEKTEEKTEEEKKEEALDQEAQKEKYKDRKKKKTTKKEVLDDLE